MFEAGKTSGPSRSPLALILNYLASLRPLVPLLVDRLVETLPLLHPPVTSDATASHQQVDAAVRGRLLAGLQVVLTRPVDGEPDGFAGWPAPSSGQATSLQILHPPGDDDQPDHPRQA